MEEQGDDWTHSPELDGLEAPQALLDESARRFETISPDGVPVGQPLVLPDGAELPPALPAATDDTTTDDPAAGTGLFGAGVTDPDPNIPYTQREDLTETYTQEQPREHTQKHKRGLHGPSRRTIRRVGACAWGSKS